MEGDDPSADPPGSGTELAAPSVDEVVLSIPGSDDLPELTRLELKRVTAKYATFVLREAGRLEAGSSSRSGAQMITPSHVFDADHWARKGYLDTVKSRSKRARLLTVGSYALAIVCGWFINNIDKPWGSVGFSVCFISGVLAFIFGGMN